MNRFDVIFLEQRVKKLEAREKELESRLARLEDCAHEYEIVGGRNTNYRIYYNGCNAYIRCTKCNHRKRV